MYTTQNFFKSKLYSPLSLVVAEPDVAVGPVGGDGGDAAAAVDLGLDRPPPRAALHASDPHAQPRPAPENKQIGILGPKLLLVMGYEKLGNQFAVCSPTEGR